MCAQEYRRSSILWMGNSSVQTLFICLGFFWKSSDINGVCILGVCILCWLQKYQSMQSYWELCQSKWYLKLHVQMHFLCLVTANIKDLHFLVFFSSFFILVQNWDSTQNWTSKEPLTNVLKVGRRFQDSTQWSKI